jgi:hypothetical protein
MIRYAGVTICHPDSNDFRLFSDEKRILAEQAQNKMLRSSAYL